MSARGIITTIATSLAALAMVACGAVRAATGIEARSDSRTATRATALTGALAGAPVVAPSAGISLAFVGDVIFGRYRADRFVHLCGGPCDASASPLREVIPLLAADITVGNLETPVVRALPARAPIDTAKVFGATPTQVALLRASGFTALAVANNHWFDQRFEGVLETPEILREHGIVALGEAVRSAPWVRAVTVERRGVRVGFVAFTTVLNKPLVAGRPMVPFVDLDAIERRVVSVVREAARSNDVVVAVAHWGEEYAPEPSSAQVRAARALIDAGALLVIGHHPHVLQRIERYRRGLIAYSLGNFLFDNPALEQRETGVLRVRAARGCLEGASFHGATIALAPRARVAPNGREHTIALGSCDSRERPVN